MTMETDWTSLAKIKNLVKWTLLVFAILHVNLSNVKAQYHWTKRIYTDSNIVPPDQLADYRIGCAPIRGKMRLYIRPVSDSTRVLIKELNLTTFKVEDVDTVNLPPAKLLPLQFLALPKHDVLIGRNEMLVYSRTPREVFRFTSDSLMFNKVYRINDSLIFLSRIYNYHPADDEPGFHGHVFNVNSKTFITTRRHDFPGLALSFFAANWVFADEGGIYAVAPLTGVLLTYTTDFRYVSKTQIPAIIREFQRNRKFEDSTDKAIEMENSTLQNIYVNFGVDSIRRNKSLRNSSTHTQEFDAFISKHVREQMEYIERVIPYSDSTVILSVSRPGYETKMRDLYYYNYKSNKITATREKWLCRSSDTSYSIEDFIHASTLFNDASPTYFYKDKVFVNTHFNVDVFKGGPRDSVRKIFFKDGLKNNYKWSVLEYQL